MKFYRFALLFSAAFLLNSCFVNNVGPCEHTYKEPVLNVLSIKDTINYKSINFIKIRDLKINGSNQFGVNPLLVSYNVVFGDSIYYCNIPFGFGAEEGCYEFIIEAEGYAPKRIILDNVKYSVFEGGCPSFNDGGEKVNLIIN